MATPYVQSAELVKTFHLAENGFRYNAAFEIKFVAGAMSDLLLNVLWNEDRTLLKGTTKVERKISGAGISIIPTGIGWAEVNDIPGEDAWVQYSTNIIRFRKRVALKVPASPLALVPVFGEKLKDVGIVSNWRMEAEGFLQVFDKYLSSDSGRYISDLQVRIY